MPHLMQEIANKDAEIARLRAALDGTLNWLEGCLECKTWNWDGLQREAAEMAVNEGRGALCINQQQAESALSVSSKER